MIAEQDKLDEYFMARALTLARKGLYTSKPNPRVGCVLVKEGRVIGEGWHKYAGQAHAEIDALNNATENPLGATAYVTLEPCSHHGKTPPCSEALIKSGIKRVVAAMQDPNPLVSGQGLAHLKAAQIEVIVGVLEVDAIELNRGFVMRMTNGRPFVSSKLAMSLDGRTAMATGESQWITSPESRADVQKLRAQSSAILTGINTVLKDNPSLTARVDEDVIPPIRVILDSKLQTPVTAKMSTLPGRILILTCSYSRQNYNKSDQKNWVDQQNKKTQQLEDTGFEIHQFPQSNGRISLPEVMLFLAKQQINDVLVEAGSILNGALINANIVDELIVYMAPIILGDQGRGLFNVPNLSKLADSKKMIFKEVRQVGNDIKITLKR